ncbi:MAG: hypothetical protein ACRBBS_13050 [Thalassovita sp.]
MSLTVLLLLVTGGIVGIVVLLHLLGLSNRRVFEDESAVRGVWLAEYPGHEPFDLILSRNRHYALVSSCAGAGIVWPMGVDGAARLLLGVRVTPTPVGLDLDLPDFTAPRIRLQLDQDEASLWRTKIEGQR